MFSNCSLSSISHSQTTKTSHPWRESLWIFSRSRCLLASSLGFQKSRRDLGSLASLHPGSGCRCQKHPCTNITFFRLGNTKSGMLGKLRRCRRYRYPIPCTRRRTIISGLVSLLRMRLIRSLRSFGVRVSVMVRELCPAVDRTALSLARAVETVKSVEAKNLRS